MVYQDIYTFDEVKAWLHMNVRSFIFAEGTILSIAIELLWKLLKLLCLWYSIPKTFCFLLIENLSIMLYVNDVYFNTCQNHDVMCVFIAKIITVLAFSLTTMSRIGENTYHQITHFILLCILLHDALTYDVYAAFLMIVGHSVLLTTVFATDYFQNPEECLKWKLYGNEPIDLFSDPKDLGALWERELSGCPTARESKGSMLLLLLHPETQQQSQPNSH